MLSTIPARARHAADLAGSIASHPIIVQADSTLTVWSTVRFPRAGERACVISYQPQYDRYLDYSVGHECGHIYRFFSALPEERLLPAVDSRTLFDGAAELESEARHLRSVMPSERLGELLRFYCIGLVQQATNIPADCRIEIWLHDTFSELRDMQADALEQMYRTFSRCQSDAIKRLTPPTVYCKSNAMNYPLVKTITRLLAVPRLLEPYVESGFDEVGERLTSYLGGEDRGYMDDRRIADAWARELDLDRFYRWRLIT